MKLSLDWLSDYVTWNEQDPQVIADRITTQVAEVDELILQGKWARNCVLGKVANLRKHPGADRLNMCEVMTTQGTYPIVCGGSNLREGMLIAFAPVGASVYSPKGPFTLGAIKIRGEASEGMICAASELELEEMFPDTPEMGDRPVIDLGDGELVAGSLAEYLKIDDVVIDVDNHAITNRPDLFSHLGFARECVAIGIANWKYKPNWELKDVPTGSLPFNVHNEVPELVPCYRAIQMQVDGFKETPNWMKQRLIATGWRPVSTMVDIANYVMMDVGQPLHGFDSDDFIGDIHVRAAKQGEHVTTLDNKQRKLPEGSVVLSDDEGIFDLFGIMGGLRTSSKDTTKNIFLQAAICDQVSVRRTMVAMGHRTDAGTVYEKGVPHIATEIGLIRAIELLKELAVNMQLTAEFFDGSATSNTESIVFNVQQAASLLGTDISDAKAIDILHSLECAVTGSGEQLMVEPPAFRTDLTSQQDLTEELGRVIGYQNIKPVLPTRAATLPARDTRLKKLRNRLKEAGGFELLPLSMIGPTQLQKAGFNVDNCQVVSNPIGEETSLMQPSLVPALLEHAETQFAGRKELLTFSVGNVFSKQGEHSELSVLLAQKNSSDIKTLPLYRLQQLIADALIKIGYQVQYKASASPAQHVHPGRASVIIVNNKEVGYIAELHPEVMTAMQLPNCSAVVSINLQELLALNPSDIIAKKLKEYPAISYDETIERSHSQRTAELLQTLQGATELLESVEVVDTYQPQGSASYNLTLRFTYRSKEKTLTEQEVKPEHQKVMSTMSV
jgi:phenylalanyl-tRNA synthetase beta chain